MREIKFRAWDEKDNRMIYLESSGLQYFDFEGNYSLGFTVDGYSEFWAHEQYDSLTKDAANFPIMQFTGLHDKNGKEIYEGDVIQFKHYRVNKRWWSTVSEIPIIEKEVLDQKTNYRTEKETVVFKDGGFRLGDIELEYVGRGKKYESGQTHHCDYEEKWWDFEIIGNIYEQPDSVE